MRLWTRFMTSDACLKKTDGANSEREKILKRLRKNEIGGRECARALSDLMDGQLSELAETFLQDCEGITMVATGGYGRQELCPFSDVDLMFLIPKKAGKQAEECAEKFLYALWDTGLKAGHAVRTIQDCVDMAGQDMTILTSLLDARLLWGSSELFDEMTTKIEKIQKKRRTKYVNEKLAERDQRHQRLGDTRYVLEPNIKDGKGGLRDYQTLFWITDVLYEARTPIDLVKHDILLRKEAANFKKSHEFLLTVRCHLHDIAGRAEERLHFDVQPALAKRLGYTDRNNGKAVERFMKHYFLLTRDIGDLTRIICAFIEEHEQKQKAKADSVMGFRLMNGRLTFPEWQDLKEHPVEMIRLFRVAQETGYDIHPFAVRAISKNLAGIDKIRRDPMANQLFLEILTGRKGAATTLLRLNESGILGRFIPDFGKVIAMMQFDRYHVFTVDEHTLRAIDILHQIEDGKLRDQAPLATRLIGEISERRALYVAMMLHDICKGRGGDHSLLGAELSLKLGPRLGLSDHETRLVSWLVFDHLVMSSAAFKRDLEDPKTIEDFTFRVYDLERLKLLTLLTTADIMAVGPERWTAWKANLMAGLYKKAESALKGEKTVTGDRISLPDDFTPDKDRIDITNDPGQQTTRVTVYTTDRPGLFSTLAGGLSAAGANIIEARINTLEDGTVVDEFTVQNLSGRPFEKKWRQEEIKKSILQALRNKLDIRDGIARYTVKPAKKDEVFDIPTKIKISGKASNTDTVIEISTRDRPGLLYDLTCALGNHGLQIRSAKISTTGLKATDVFYVQNKEGNKIKTNIYEKIRNEIRAYANPDTSQ